MCLYLLCILLRKCKKQTTKTSIYSGTNTTKFLMESISSGFIWPCRSQQGGWQQWCLGWGVVAEAVQNRWDRPNHTGKPLAQRLLLPLVQIAKGIAWWRYLGTSLGYQRFGSPELLPYWKSSERSTAAWMCPSSMLKFRDCILGLFTVSPLTLPMKSLTNRNFSCRA